MKRVDTLSLSAVVGGVLAASCTTPVPLDPRGDEVSLRGQWTIGGAAPTATSCQNLGAVSIGLAFREDDGDHLLLEELLFPCEQGSFQTGPILAHARYDMTWQAFEAEQDWLLSGQSFGLDAVQETDLVVPTGEFP